MNEFEFVALKSMRVLAVAKSGETNSACADAWQVLIDYVIKNNLISKVERRISQRYKNIHTLEELEACSVGIVLEGDEVKLEGEVQELELAGGSYAVFLHRGSYDEIKNSYIKARDFLKSTDVTLQDAMPFERYVDIENENGGEESQKVLLHIPII